MARVKIEQTKYKCADCENCIPYEKGFLNYERKPILAGCIEQENNSRIASEINRYFFVVIYLYVFVIIL